MNNKVAYLGNDIFLSSYDTVFNKVTYYEYLLMTYSNILFYKTTLQKSNEVKTYSIQNKKDMNIKFLLNGIEVNYHFWRNSFINDILASCKLDTITIDNETE